MIYVIGVFFLVLVIALYVLIQNIVKQGSTNNPKPNQSKVNKAKPKQARTNQAKSNTKNNYKISEEHQRKNNRKGELGEFKIDLQLEQLPKEFKSLSDILIRTNHRLTQIDHVVISTVGLFVIETKNYQGEISGKKREKTWKAYSKGRRYPIHNPFFQNYGHIKGLETLLNKYTKLKFYSIISFTKRCVGLRVDDELKTGELDQMVVMDIRLSDLILRKYRKVLAANAIKQLNNEEIEEIYQIIKNANITDPAIREEHIQEVKKKQA
jgi:hypothetical protein